MTRAEAPDIAGQGMDDVTSTGLPPRFAAALAYSAWWVTGALFLALEPRHPFVRYHARQAVVVFGLLWLIGVALWIAGFLAVFLSPGLFRVIALLSHGAWLLAAAAWVICLVQAARGKTWQVPLIGRPFERAGA